MLFLPAAGVEVLLASGELELSLLAVVGAAVLEPVGVDFLAFGRTLGVTD